MQPKLSIGALNEDNFEQFIGLINELAYYEGLEPPDEETRKRLKRDGLGEKRRYEGYIGTIDDVPAGYLILFYNYSSFLARPVLYVEDIYVREEYRRFGMGKALFDMCKKRAEEEECARMEWCVLTWNRNAMEFYEAMGARKLDWFFYRYDFEEKQ